ncbi:MAG: hypothetical protein V1819_01190 [bacterium]
MKNLIVLTLSLAFLCVLLVGCGESPEIQSVALRNLSYSSLSEVSMDWEFELLAPIQEQRVIVLRFAEHPAQDYHHFLEGVGLSKINFEGGHLEEVFYEGHEHGIDVPDSHYVGHPLHRSALVLVEGSDFEGINNMPRYAVWRDHDYSNVGDYEGRWNLVKVEPGGKGTIIGVTNKLPDW